MRNKSAAITGSRDLADVVDARGRGERNAGVATQGVQVIHASARIEKSMIVRLANDLARAVNPIRAAVIPAKRAQIDHASARIEKGMIIVGVVVSVSLANDLARAINPMRVAVWAA